MENSISALANNKPFSAVMDIPVIGEGLSYALGTWDQSENNLKADLTQKMDAMKDEIIGELKEAIGDAADYIVDSVTTTINSAMNRLEKQLGHLLDVVNEGIHIQYAKHFE